jgi:hypothetical protein
MVERCVAAEQLVAGVEVTTERKGRTGGGRMTATGRWRRGQGVGG